MRRSLLQLGLALLVVGCTPTGGRTFGAQDASIFGSKDGSGNSGGPPDASFADLAVRDMATAPMPDLVTPIKCLDGDYTGQISFMFMGMNAGTGTITMTADPPNNSVMGISSGMLDTTGFLNMTADISGAIDCKARKVTFTFDNGLADFNGNSLPFTGGGTADYNGTTANMDNGIAMTLVNGGAQVDGTFTAVHN